jgi:hypothetical protein
MPRRAPCNFLPLLQQWEQKLTPRDGIYSLLAEWEVAGSAGPDGGAGPPPPPRGEHRHGGTR